MFGVVVPDLPGCFSAGETPDEAMSGAEEAALGWIDSALESGEAMPAASGLEAIQQNPDYAGWIFGLISPGRSRFAGSTARRC
jgi:predicted RNase H-like HicB family nuclease